MQSETMIDNIREGGVAQGAKQAQERFRMLKEGFGFRTVDKAEYALIASCFNPYLEPEDMRAFRNILEYYDVNYTLLPKEYCCGDPFYLHFVNKKHEGDLELADELGREFFEKNLEQARKKGAGKILAYCAGCDMVFERFSAEVTEEILWHPTLLARLFQGGKLKLEADFYPGCHRYRQKINGSLPDIDAVRAVLSRIEGLKLNEIGNDLCCMKPDELDSLVPAVEHKTIIAPCSGCTLFLRKSLADKGDYRVCMLSEVVWAALQGHEL